MFNKKLFCLLIIPFLFNACTEDPSSIGAQLLEQDLINVEELNSFTDSLPQTSSYFKREIKLGTSNMLMIGKSHNVEASTLIKFLINPHDSLDSGILGDSIIITEAKVQFTKTYVFGDSNSTFDFSAHKITSDWSSAGFTADSLPSLMFDPADAASNKDLTDSLLTFTLDNQLALSWLKAAADTSDKSDKGIFIKPGESVTQVAGFQALISTTGAPIPKLFIVIEKPGVYVDTLDFISTLDVSVVSGPLPDVSPENIVVQSGLAANAKVWFDLSSIPENVIINSAQLTLTLDSTETVTGSVFRNSLLVYNLADTTSKDSITAEAIQLVRQNNTFTAKITSYVKDWVSKNNLGLLIRPGDQLTGVEIFAIKGSSASDAALRPQLTITYTRRK